MHSLVSIAPAAFLLATAALPISAQAAPERSRVRGLTLDHWVGASGPALLRPTLRLTTFRGRGMGPDLALVIFPDGISIHPPIFMVGLQAGLAQPVPIGPATLLLKAGAAGLATTGILADSKLLHLVPGVQGGLGLLLPVDRRSSLRLDVTRHVYRTGPYGRDVWSFGVGVSGGLRR